MLVLVQVSSMKTRREGSMRGQYLSHCALRRATSGRSCSAAISVFFVTEPLGVDELPYRAVIDLHSALCQLTDKPAQGKIRCPAAVHQPVMMASRDRLWLVTAHPAWLEAAGLAQASHPGDRSAVAHAKMRRR